ncbi:MAG: hypothetical protein ACFB20_03760 [Opitutales bacterium]
MKMKIRIPNRLFSFTVALGLLSATALHGDAHKATADHVSFLPEGPAITLEDVQKAQKGWGNAVVANR